MSKKDLEKDVDQEVSKEKKSGVKRWVNVGQRAFQLKPREKSQANFSFEPGDVIEAANPEEEKYFTEHGEIQEYVEKPKSDAERVKELEAENSALRAQVEELSK